MGIKEIFFLKSSPIPVGAVKLVVTDWPLTEFVTFITCVEVPLPTNVGSEADVPLPANLKVV